MRKCRVVVDTNVLVSGFVFGGNSQRVLQEVFSNHSLFVSPELLDEYRNTSVSLEQTDKINSFQSEILIAGIAAFVSQAHLVYPEETLDICRDSEDNMILECCFAVKADFLITGDKDLLDIDRTLLPAEIHNLKIITPQDFLKSMRL